APTAPRATVDLAGAVHRQARRFVRDDQPFYPIDIGLALAKVVRVAFEDRLDVRFIALQKEGASTDGRLRFLQVAELLHHFRGNNPRARRVRQHTDEPDEGLFEDEFNRVTVHHLDAVYGVQDIAVPIAFFRQEAVIGEFDVLGHQFAAVDGRLVVP